MSDWEYWFCITRGLPYLYSYRVGLGRSIAIGIRFQSMRTQHRQFNTWGPVHKLHSTNVFVRLVWTKILRYPSNQIEPSTLGLITRENFLLGAYLKLLRYGVHFL